MNAAAWVAAAVACGAACCWFVQRAHDRAACADLDAADALDIGSGACFVAALACLIAAFA